MKYDVIIIGGGLGGLTAGAKLAKAGKRILLLERHDRPGGCATTFLRKGYVMEVGLHEMDGLHEADGKTRIFNELGVTDVVDFLPLPEFYRFFNGRTDFVMPHGKEEAVLKLKRHFPEESAGIDQYFERLTNARRIAMLERDTPDISIGEFLDSIFASDEIKLVVLGNLGYFHDDPYSLSLRYFSMAESAYFNGRANYIKGGSQRLSDRLMAIIREHGGEVLLNHQVTAIRVENGKVAEVEYARTPPGDRPAEKAQADEYVLNAALPLAIDLMGGNEGESLKKQLERQTIGASLLSVYFGFSKSLKDLGNSYYSTFVFDESVKRLADIKPNNRSDFRTRSYTFVDYSQIDSTLAPEGKSIGAICCIDYLEDWEGLSGEAYRAKKKEVAAIFADRLNRLIPGCKDYIEYIEVGTPKTVKRYTLNPGGAVYGFAQAPNRIPVAGVESVPNLHIASAWGKFGGGFSGAIFSGYMAAMELLRKKR